MPQENINGSQGQMDKVQTETNLWCVWLPIIYYPYKAVYTAALATKGPKFKYNFYNNVKWENKNV